MCHVSQNQLVLPVTSEEVPLTQIKSRESFRTEVTLDFSNGWDSGVLHEHADIHDCVKHTSGAKSKFWRRSASRNQELLYGNEITLFEITK